MASPQRIEANRRNAQKSTGPRTVEGKARSSRNALKHGLAGQGLVLPEEEAAELTRRTGQWSPRFGPATPYEHWLMRQIALASLRLDRCWKLESAQRGLAVERAFGCWDDDRAVEAERVAARMKRNPALVVRQLRQSKHGCAWLIARWQFLGRVLAVSGTWDDTQRTLAFDLLGVPVDERSFDPRLPADAPAEALRALVDAELDGLQTLKAETLDDLDDDERELTQADLNLDGGEPARLLRRYEASAQRLLDWALRQLESRARKYGALPPEADLDDEPEPEPDIEPELQAGARVARETDRAASPSPSTQPPPALPAVRPRPEPGLVPRPLATLVAIPRPAPRNRQERRAAEKQARSSR